METLPCRTASAEGPNVKTLDLDLSELEKIQSNNYSLDYGLSLKEICEKTGRSDKWVLKRLKVLATRGRLKVIYKPITRVDGRNQSIPTYRW